MGVFVKVSYLIDAVNSSFLSGLVNQLGCGFLTAFHWGGCRVCFVMWLLACLHLSKPNFLLQVLSICMQMHMQHKFLTALMILHSVCLHLSFIRKLAEEELLY